MEYRDGTVETKLAPMQKTIYICPARLDRHQVLRAKLPARYTRRSGMRRHVVRSV